MLIVAAVLPVFAGARAASPTGAIGDCKRGCRSLTSIDLLSEVRHQSEEITNAASETDRGGAFAAVSAARAALDCLRALMEAPEAGGDGRRLERRFIDTDELGELLLDAEAALRSGELPALMLYSGELTELADRMLARHEFDDRQGRQSLGASTPPLEPESENASQSSRRPTISSVGSECAQGGKPTQ